MLSFLLFPAMLAMFLSGPMSSDDDDPVRADGDGADDDDLAPPPGDDGDDDPPSGDDDGTDDKDDADDGVDKAGNRILIRDGAEGTVNGTSGKDEITVTAEGDVGFVIEGPFEFWDTVSGEPPLVVRGNGGDDVMTLSGSGYLATGGAGADRLTLDGVHSAVIIGEAGDTIFGQDDGDIVPGEAAPLIRLIGTGTFSGGSSAEVVVLDGNGGLADGGRGDDTLYAFDGASTLRGGDGDDWIDADATSSTYDGSQDSRLSDLIGPPGDVVDGGAGDDRLFAGYGDRLTGGAGRDTFALAFDNVAGRAGAVVTDFDPATDRLEVSFDEYDERDPSFTYAGRITTTTSAEGWVEIRGDGEVLVTLQGQTSVRIGWALLEDGPFTGLDGAPVDRADLDIVVTPFLKITT